MLKKVSFFLLFGLMLSTNNLLAQDQEAKPRGNLPNYFSEKLHFGFTLGINRANFRINYNNHFERYDSIKAIESRPKYGFNLGIVSELRLHNNITLRFVPNISFAERNLLYYIEGKKDTIVKDKSIESTFLNFPLDLKLRSKRLQNFDAYLIAGGGYSLDLASKRKTKNSSEPDEQIVRLKRDDFSYEAGVGFEFYLEYFKFAIEGKMINGTKNLIIKDNTIFSNPIDKLNSKIFLFSITFEG
jgi:Outer membrane protein beta-barrel domain